MYIKQKPKALNFLGSLPDLIINEVAGDLSIKIDTGEDGSSPLLLETYAPDPAGTVTVKLREIAGQVFDLKLEDVPFDFVRSSNLQTFHVTAGTTKIVFAVIAGRIEEMDDMNFVNEGFLNMCGQVKKSDIDAVEILNLYNPAAGNSLKAVCHLEYRSAPVELDLGTLPVGLLIIPVNFRAILNMLPNGTGLVAVDIRVSGWPVEKGQRFEFAERQPDDDLYYFENALGGIDMIRFTGEKTLKRKYSSATAQQDELTVDYDNDAEVSYVKNSGYLDTALEKEFAADFLRSDNRYHITGKRIKRIILLETESKTQDLSLNEFEFEYRYQREDVFALLRTFAALPVSIGTSLAISQDNDIYRLNLEIEKLKRELEELEERMEKGDGDLKAKIEEIKTTITLINDAVISKTLTYSSSKIESMFQLFANIFPFRRSGWNVKWKELGEKFVDDWSIQDSQIFPIMVCGGIIESAAKGGGIRIRYGVKSFSVSHPLNNYRTTITHNLGKTNYFFVGVPEITGVAYGRCVVINEISDNYIVVAKLVSSTATSENDADFPFHFAIFATDDYRSY